MSPQSLSLLHGRPGRRLRVLKQAAGAVVVSVPRLLPPKHSLIQRGPCPSVISRVELLPALLLIPDP